MSLSLRDITHRFGDLTAVNEASVEAAAGEIVCLFGHSGCGKTTLLRLAAGLETLQSGVIELDGDIIAVPGRDMPTERRSIGMVFQDFVLFPHMTVEKNVGFGLAGADDATSQIADQLNAQGLNKYAQRYPHELSGGQQQRVALARALARSPRALLLDEPFASIDAVLRRELRESMRRILKEQNVAVVLVTHDPEEALALGDRIALMRAGRIIETASPQQLFEKPQSPEGAGVFPGSQRLAGIIESGWLKTSAGKFPAENLSDGPGIAVLHEGALSAYADEGGAFAVTDVRFAGPDWMVWLEGRVDPVRLRLRMPTPPEEGATMAIAADLAKTFVFSDE